MKPITPSQVLEAAFEDYLLALELIDRGKRSVRRAKERLEELDSLEATPTRVSTMFLIKRFGLPKWAVSAVICALVHYVSYSLLYNAWNGEITAEAVLHITAVTSLWAASYLGVLICLVMMFLRVAGYVIRLEKG